MPQHVENTAHRTGIELQQLSAGYRHNTIVHDICLTIPQGKMTVLVGANGSGKSTLLSTIARMLKPHGGSVLLDGKAIYQQPTKAVSRQLGILPQSPLVPKDLPFSNWYRVGVFPGRTCFRNGRTMTNAPWSRHSS